MNVTELARKVRMQTAELRELIPKLGFDVGKKAIKVDDAVAEKIIAKIKEHPELRTSGLVKEKEKKTEEVKVHDQTIVLPPYITVRDFATAMGKTLSEVIQELMKNGILASLNERIDYETAAIIASDFGMAVAQKKQTEEPAPEQPREELQVEEHNLQPRPPVVVVIGHVDHGKTMLLDAIRRSNVVGQEAGGITQHIGAYQLARNGKLITFIDTPGHQAFTMMRSRGARVADIAILVIAADEGIKPQTEEAIKIIEGAKLSIIVALNKMDKPEANPEKAKRQLAEKNLLPEEWGGKTIVVPVSAKTGQGIEELLNTILLVADVERDHIRADPTRDAVGTIIESRIDKGEGPVAAAIVQSGTLRTGQFIHVGSVTGKIKFMKNYLGERIHEAGPSMPVKILGLKYAPEVGDILRVQTDEKELKKLMRGQKTRAKGIVMERPPITTPKEEEEDKETVKPTLNVILRTDTLGSQEAILQELEKIAPVEVDLKIAKKGLGNITDADIMNAEHSQAAIYGFHVNLQPNAQALANEKNVPIRLYKIIYELVDDVKRELGERKPRELITVEIGRIKITVIFRREKKYMIVGGQVTKGKALVGARAHIIRHEEILGEGSIAELRKEKEKVTELPMGTECGIKFIGPTTIEEGDFLELFAIEQKA